jgi:crossover junction endodeoxyribonuclease RuvC
MHSSGAVRIIGIDPASAGTTGYGVIEASGRRCRMIALGGLPANGKHCAEERLRAIHALVEKLIAEYSPVALALESVFSALNVKTALKLSEVRGVVMLAAAQAGIPVHSYSPREVKLAVTGYGHADKRQIQQMVRAELQLSALPQPADAADALAVALCHVHCAESRARTAAAMGTNAEALAASRTRRRNGSTRLPESRIQSTR